MQLTQLHGACISVVPGFCCLVLVVVDDMAIKSLGASESAIVVQR